MNYLDAIKDKRQEKQSADEQQDFVDSIKSVSTDVRELLSSLETSGAKKLDKRVVEAISSLATLVEALKTVKVENDTDTKEALANIADILSRINVQPIVNVKAPQVTVQEREISFDPLIQALNKPELKDNDPLAGYKAQDIDNNGPHTQYVGFVNSDGNWYIIENNDEENSLRYVFGKKGYATAFKNASKLNYKLYSEAINAVKA